MITHSKDDRHTIIGTGIVTPAIFGVMVLGHLLSGVAWLPEPQIRLVRYLRAESWHRLTTGDWGFWCLLAGECGLIFGCLGWYCFANVKRLEWLARPFVFFGYLGLCIALAGFCVGIFKSLCWIA